MGASQCRVCCHHTEDDQVITPSVERKTENSDPDPFQEDPVGFTDAKRSGALTQTTTGSTTHVDRISSSDKTLSEEGLDENVAFRNSGVESIRDCEELLESVRQFCREGRVFDAVVELKRLELEVSERTPLPHSDGGAWHEFAANLRKDPLIGTLHAVHDRMTSVLETMGPRALPGGKEDKRWVHTVIQDRAIGPDFSADIKIRFAEGGERDPNGASTQLITCGHLTSFPMDLDRFVSVYRETDIYQKQWIADCESCEGEVAGLEKMYSALSKIINSSPLLPVRLEVLTVREFAVCPTSPFPDRGPGVLVMDMSAPIGASNFAGWELPTPLRRASRLSGLGLILYFTPRRDQPGHCDVFAFAKAGAPVPQWLIPLSLLKRFFAHHFLSVFKAIKNHIVDDWDNLEYGNRITKCPDFYSSISRLVKG